MKSSIAGKGKEVLNAHVKWMADRFPHSKDYIVKIDLDQDDRITRWFPAFLVVCIALWLTLLISSGDFSMSSILKYLCLSFVFCFMVIGVVLFRSMGQGPLPKWSLVVVALILAFIIVLSGEVTFDRYIVNLVKSLIESTGHSVDSTFLMALAIGFMAAVLIFTPVGVLTVTSAYLKKYFAGVFIAMQNNADSGQRGLAEGFFDVPDIIDVKKVIMEPELDYREYNAGVAMDLWIYNTLMGLVVSSYFFLSPFFLDSMTSLQMTSIMVMLAMFIPVIVIVWQIVRDVDAQIVSDAPRTYHLWRGAKKRLFESFAGLGLLSMMFLVTLYFGYSLQDMLVNYLRLMLPLVCVALMNAVMYTNNFNNALKAVLYMRFEEGVGRSDSKE